MRVYIGQEKIRMHSGMFKGICGYVRIAHPDGRLWVILDNGIKTSSHINDVEFIHPNYFLSWVDPEKLKD